MPSWGSHLEIVAGTTDGFVGDIPVHGTGGSGPGWGCDSLRDAQWWNGSTYVKVPSCVPDQSGQGPYRPSPVSWVPTIMDELDQYGLTWRFYAGKNPRGKAGDGYGWAMCPSFYECLNDQSANLAPANRVLSDAAAGLLPNVSIVTPTGANSQHNEFSMLAGDNWIGAVVSAIEAGPQWGSTAIFVLYDDCGCFYDHVPPPAGVGPRVPAVIVSPYVRAGYTDSTPASLFSILAYIEHNWNLPPLSGTSGENGVYAYRRSFDYGQVPLAPVRMTAHPVRPWELRWIARHPAADDDPT